MRGCDGCTLCCKLIGIHALNKPQGVWCPHCEIGKGCKIYSSRPGPCGDWLCRYVVDDTLDESWKPSECGIVINADKDRVVVYVDPVTPSAWRKEPFYSTLKNWSKTNRPGWPILVSVGHEIFAMRPTGDVRVR